MKPSKNEPRDASTDDRFIIVSVAAILFTLYHVAMFLADH